MNLQTYLERKNQLAASSRRQRKKCTACWQPDFACYCSQVKSFDCQIQFVILIHPLEVRRRIATGRMSHLCLKNSHLIPGLDYSNDPQVNKILQNPDNHCVVLYPGIGSVNLSKLPPDEAVELFPAHKQLVVFVIDGTWNTVKKMLRFSPNVLNLPRICFTPTHLSNFKVRKQPAPECYSTIEAIHQTIELLGPSRGFSTLTQEHNNLLSVFNHMVNAQLKFIASAPEPAYRRVQKV